MLRRLLSITGITLLALFLAVVQLSFNSALPEIYSYIMPGIIALVFLLFFFELPYVLLFLTVFGLASEVLSFQVKGSLVLSLTLTVFIFYFILRDYLTNKSLYSFLLTILGFTLVFNLSLSLFQFLISGLMIKLTIFSSIFWLSVAYQLFWSFLFALVFFFPLIFWFKRFMPFFLEKK